MKKAQSKLGPCKVFQNVGIIPKCLDPQRTIFQRSYFSMESQCATTMEYFLPKLQAALVSTWHQEEGKKKVVGTVKKDSETV